jgi:hypothetical protein
MEKKGCYIRCNVISLIIILIVGLSHEPIDIRLLEMVILYGLIYYRAVYYGRDVEYNDNSASRSWPPPADNKKTLKKNTIEQSSLGGLSCEEWRLSIRVSYLDNILENYIKRVILFRLMWKDNKFLPKDLLSHILIILKLQYLKIGNMEEDFIKLFVGKSNLLK